MQQDYVLNVMSIDRPGIVAGVSAALLAQNGNIESCSQTVLNGFFTLIMTFRMPEVWEVSQLESTILQSPGLENCQIIIRQITDPPQVSADKHQNIFVVTAFGPDQNGIIARFSSYLAGKEINIIDLYGDLTPEGHFVLISQVEVDTSLDIQNLQFDLAELGEELGFTVRVQHNNIFVATNRLRLDR